MPAAIRHNRAIRPSEAGLYPKSGFGLSTVSVSMLGIIYEKSYRKFPGLAKMKNLCEKSYIICLFA
jgi:hypothetical protein